MTREPPTSGTAKLSRSSVYLVAVLAVIVGAWVYQTVRAPGTPNYSESSVGTSISPGFIPRSEVNRLVGAYEQRVVAQTDAADFRTLGFLYLEDARLDGDVSRYAAAEEAFDRALQLFPSDPSSAIGAASAAYSLHDFEAAEGRAGEVYASTGRPDALAILVDAKVALGEYQQVDDLLEELETLSGTNPAVWVRQAEWARLNGDSVRVTEIVDDIVAETGTSPNPRLRSWYGAFGAQTLFYVGEYGAALELAEKAADDDPESLSARVTLARLLAAHGEYDRADDLYQSVTSVVPDPAFLAEQAAVSIAMGDRRAAEDAYATIAVAAQISADSGVYDRSIALSVADRVLAGDTTADADEAVAIAEHDLERRSDVGAFDTLAWALFAAGRANEAMAAAEQAVSMETLNASYYYHAGIIAAARGHDQTARTYLARALEVSPRFDPLHADIARTAWAESP